MYRMQEQNLSDQCPLLLGKTPIMEELGIKYVFDTGGRPGFYNGLGKGAFEAALARLLIHTTQGLWKYVWNS